jgi:hypothetical protein
VAFAGEDAVLVSDQSLAAVFFIDTLGFLVSGGQYVDADYNFAYIAFQLTPARPKTLSTFSVGSDNTLLIDYENNGFCVTDSSNIFILFSATETPFYCNPIILTVVFDLPSKSCSNISECLPR